VDNFLKKIKEKHGKKDELTFDSIHHILMKEYGYIPFEELVGYTTETTYHILGCKLPITSKTSRRPQLQISVIMGLLRHIQKDGEEIQKKLDKQY
jgi:hypothetical protein